MKKKMLATFKAPHPLYKSLKVIQTRRVSDKMEALKIADMRNWSLECLEKVI